MTSAPTPAPAPSISSRGLSTLSSDLQFEGTVSGGGDLQVDGSVKGDIRVGRLIVGETGAVEGNVSADYLEVRGRIVGGVTASRSSWSRPPMSTATSPPNSCRSTSAPTSRAACCRAAARLPAVALLRPPPRRARPTPAADAFSAPPLPAEEKPQIIEMKPTF
jgi:hypothetical protein